MEGDPPARCLGLIAPLLPTGQSDSGKGSSGISISGSGGVRRSAAKAGWNLLQFPAVLARIADRWGRSG